MIKLKFLIPLSIERKKAAKTLSMITNFYDDVPMFSNHTSIINLHTLYVQYNPLIA